MRRKGIRHVVYRVRHLAQMLQTTEIQINVFHLPTAWKYLSLDRCYKVSSKKQYNADQSNLYANLCVKGKCNGSIVICTLLFIFVEILILF